jgi:RNase P/RNase MRP subunit POP5
MDPNELATIINSSLRHWYGDCQQHSVGLQVLKCQPSPSSKRGGTGGGAQALLECSTCSVEQIRAALTFSESPAHLKDTLYCFDIIKVETAAIIG